MISRGTVGGRPAGERLFRNLYRSLRCRGGGGGRRHHHHGKSWTLSLSRQRKTESSNVIPKGCRYNEVIPRSCEPVVPATRGSSRAPLSLSLSSTKLRFAPLPPLNSIPPRSTRHVIKISPTKRNADSRDAGSRTRARRRGLPSLGDESSGSLVLNPSSPPLFPLPFLSSAPSPFYFSSSSSSTTFRKSHIRGARTDPRTNRTLPESHVSRARNAQNLYRSMLSLVSWVYNQRARDSRGVTRQKKPFPEPTR